MVTVWALGAQARMLEAASAVIATSPVATGAKTTSPLGMGAVTVTCLGEEEGMVVKWAEA